MKVVYNSNVGDQGTVKFIDDAGVEQIFNVATFRFTQEKGITAIEIIGQRLEGRQVALPRVRMYGSYLARFFVILVVAAAFDRYYNQRDEFTVNTVLSFAMYKVLEALITITSEFFVDDLFVTPFQRWSSSPHLQE